MRRVMLAMKSATLAIAMRNFWQPSLVLLGLLQLFALPQALAADHFLTIGGGDSPSYNQVSLEKNILFYQRLLGELEGPRVEHDIYFADGAAGSRDVQYVA